MGAAGAAIFGMGGAAGIFNGTGSGGGAIEGRGGMANGGADEGAAGSLDVPAGSAAGFMFFTEMISV